MLILLRLRLGGIFLRNQLGFLVLQLLVDLRAAGGLVAVHFCGRGGVVLAGCRLGVKGLA
jgi:hypothetical protein